MLSHIVIARSTMRATRLDLREHAELSCRIFRLKQKFQEFISALKSKLQTGG